MSSYYELKEQAAELLRQAEELRSVERAKVLQQVRDTVAEWNLTMAELGLKAKPAKVKMPAKYRDPNTGKEWCGRGAIPHWLGDHLRAGYTKDQFLIA